MIFQPATVSTSLQCIGFHHSGSLYALFDCKYIPPIERTPLRSDIALPVVTWSESCTPVNDICHGTDGTPQLTFYKRLDMMTQPVETFKAPCRLVDLRPIIQTRPYPFYVNMSCL